MRLLNLVSENGMANPASLEKARCAL